MFLSGKFGVLARRLFGSGRHGTTAPRISRRCRLTLEPLEDRTVPSFLAPVNYPIDAGPVSVVVGDFNSDGVPDLVTPNFQANSVSVLLGNGDGTFQAVRNSAANKVLNLAAGDFNRDGRLDLAIETLGEYPFFEDSSVSIMLGNGDGTFQAPYRVASNGTPVVGDLNGDGNLDLAVAFIDFSDHLVGVLLGNGDGTFQRGGNFNTGGTPGGPTLGDLNGDGKLDLVATNINRDSVIVMLGNGDGSLGTAVHITAGRFPGSVALADFNGDGRLDVVATNRLSFLSSFRSTVSVLLGNGDGSFRTAVQYDVGPILSQPQTVVVGDFNGDGIPDLGAFVTSVQPGSRNVVSVLLGRGDGSFQSAGSVDVNIGAQAVAAADFNGDGFTDLATASGFFEGTVSVLLNDRDWPVVTPPDPPSEPAPPPAAPPPSSGKRGRGHGR